MVLSVICTYCGGGLEHTFITYEKCSSGQLYIFNNVPAQVCTACGNIAMNEAAFQAITWWIVQNGDAESKHRQLEAIIYDFDSTLFPLNSGDTGRE